MLKISIKTFGLPYDTGVLYKPASAYAGAAYSTEGTDILEIYKDEKDGFFGGEMLGVDRRFIVPYRVMGSVTIDRNNIIVMRGRRYEVMDIKYLDLAYIEDFYGLIMEEKNT
jgi:hypothetical protein